MFEQYKKRPVAVKACRLTIDNIDEVHKWIEQQGGMCRKVCTQNGTRLLGLKILTLEGLMNTYFGSWIIQGNAGEFYSCTHEVFEQAYDKE